MTRRAHPKIKARITPEGEWISVCGREAETLVALCDKGPLGLRAFDFQGGPALRLAAYVHDLRKLGFPIRTDREAHAGGNHAVYFVECKPTVVQVAIGPL